MTAALGMPTSLFFRGFSCTQIRKGPSQVIPKKTPMQYYAELLNRTERDDCVMSTKAEGIRNTNNLSFRELPCLCHNVKINLRILVFQINSSWSFAVVNRQYGKHCFKGSCTTQQMPRHRLGCRNSNILCMLTESSMHSSCFR